MINAVINNKFILMAEEGAEALEENLVSTPYSVI